MSENLKNINDINPSCLHCRVHNSKLKYQAIFDEVGIEIELADLLEKYFQLKVKPDDAKQQLLCQECVNTLIRFFDIDELERQQNAANAAKKSNEGKQAKRIPTTKPENAAQTDAKTNKKSAAPPENAQTTSNSKSLPQKIKLPISLDKQRIPVKNKPSLVIQPSTKDRVAARIVKSKAAAAVPIKAKEEQKVHKSSCVKTKQNEQSSKEAVAAGEQEQISALISDILDDEDASQDGKLASAMTTVRQLEDKSTQVQQGVDNAQQTPDDQDVDELEFLLEHDDDSSDMEIHPFKESSGAPSQSQSDDDSQKVEPFNFVLIKESDDIVDLYEYLEKVVKTCFETIKFDWPTVCNHCSFKSNKYEILFVHMLRRHRLPQDLFKCPIEGCTVELQGRKALAMHLVVLHAPVAEIPIYGSCPECNMTFSNILQYNKHSCAHVIKKRRGMRLYCEMCGLEFPSWKRFNFHVQFHLERHRPRACFVCSYADLNIDDLFQHLNYAHEPEGTLFCHICDRNFRDAAVFLEHNKSHSNVSSTTYNCGECNAIFETRGRLNGHMRSTHGTVISCELCNREFASESTYNIHMKKHLIIEREVHVCSNCGLLSDSNDKLIAHVESECNICFGVEIDVEMIRDAYVCEYCTAYFKSKADLRAHRDTGIHKDGIFCCQPCEKQFTDMKLYRHHTRTNQLLRSDIAHRKLEICLYYMCDYEDCTEVYINWNSLYTHKRRSHKQDIKPKGNHWVCQFCQKECRSKMSLSVHVARAHNNNNVICSICKSSYKDLEALQKHHAYWHEPMECSICFKAVKNRRNYDTHMNVVHSNNKRYSCNVCKKGFYHKSEKEAHERLHSQLYSCEKCSFTTRSKKSLAVHVLGQHFKRFDFECNLCNKRFGRRQGLSNHQNQVHKSKLICLDFYEGGCNKTFPLARQLNMHLRKEHNVNIYVKDEIDDEMNKMSADDDDDSVPTTSKQHNLRLRSKAQINKIDDEIDNYDNVDDDGDDGDDDDNDNDDNDNVDDENDNFEDDENADDPDEGDTRPADANDDDDVELKEHTTFEELEYDKTQTSSPDAAPEAPPPAKRSRRK